MTKPEGPAQEPLNVGGETKCKNCEQPKSAHLVSGHIYCPVSLGRACWYEPVDAATPAPSQPAGAREQGLVINESINDPALLKVIRWEIVDRSSNRAEWFALCHRREHAERIVDAVNARQQIAAKDAEIADANQRVEFQRSQILDLDAAVERQTALKQAAERERDSLRGFLASEIHNDKCDCLKCIRIRKVLKAGKTS